MNDCHRRTVRFRCCVDSFSSTHTFHPIPSHAYTAACIAQLLRRPSTDGTGRFALGRHQLGHLPHPGRRRGVCRHVLPCCRCRCRRGRRRRGRLGPPSLLRRPILFRRHVGHRVRVEGDRRHQPQEEEEEEEGRSGGKRRWTGWLHRRLQGWQRCCWYVPRLVSAATTGSSMAAVASFLALCEYAFICK